MAQEQPIKYGDVFLVSEKLANKPIGARDAAAMQSAENQVLGQTQRGGPASVMQSAATKNVRAGLVPLDSTAETHVDMCVTESIVGGRRIITESIGNEVVARYTDPDPNPRPDKMVAPPTTTDRDAVTIGEALEASALTAGDKPINHSDAAAIQVAEMLAIGSNKTPPGGIGSEAQAAASANLHSDPKITLADVLTDTTTKLKADKAVNIQDAERVIEAEMRNNPDMATNVGGVAESVAAAARLNQRK
ncbi:hypothetical protein RND81_13G142700 [Saponaria officinalis]|uniref:SMP domain-containing protein n=1 Tax=Saponaria officinalis TaxID=3572 RepID=A0AAW1H5L1_SAPOF